MNLDAGDEARAGLYAWIAALMLERPAAARLAMLAHAVLDDEAAFARDDDRVASHTDAATTRASA